ncbi:MAG: FmdB family zinc ribbon protein [Deltaproteobacteria bacterium]
MPIYEYKCEKCGTFETTQRITEKPLSKCPTCKGKVKKLISNTSFQLKGTGWYITDYARKGKDKEKTAAKSDNGAKSSSEIKKESKTESSSTGTEKSSSTSASSSTPAS